MIQAANASLSEAKKQLESIIKSDPTGTAVDRSHSARALTSMLRAVIANAVSLRTAEARVAAIAADPVESRKCSLTASLSYCARLPVLTVSSK